MCNISWEIMHIDTMFGTKKYERKKNKREADWLYEPQFEQKRPWVTWDFKVKGKHVILTIRKTAHVLCVILV